jgi:tRNA (guanine-N7-)-methyltransferase
LPRVALTSPPLGRLDICAELCGLGRPIWLEVGFGAGEHLAAQAERHREISFIGCEVFENGIVKMLRQIERLRLDNVRLFRGDARLVMEALPAASVDRVFILFPDPWPKRRHAKRRMVTRESLDALEVIMGDGAELRLATDDRNYLCWILEQVTDHSGFEWLARRPSDWRERPEDWPSTRYEEKARTAGRAPFFLRSRRRDRS